MEENKVKVLMRGVNKKIFGGFVRNPPATVELFVTKAAHIERALQAQASHYQRLPDIAASSS